MLVQLAALLFVCIDKLVNGFVADPRTLKLFRLSCDLFRAQFVHKELPHLVFQSLSRSDPFPCLKFSVEGTPMSLFGAIATQPSIAMDLAQYG
ncbi:MAG: hypothetical protein D6767_01850 [Candidatus Hydrogenedentota bacterium]|nr:MAG: hypothetical protein D6767_01850 [Candidatus Hydrogenedentota bacterium]